MAWNIILIHREGEIMNKTVSEYPSRLNLSILISVLVLAAPTFAALGGTSEKPIFFEPSNQANVQQCLQYLPCLRDARAYYQTVPNVGNNVNTDDQFFLNPENVKTNPEAAKAYFSKKANVAKIQTTNPKAADAYFGDIENMKKLDEKNLEGADMYFSTRGNMERFHEAGIEYLKKKYGKGLDIKMETGIGVIYDSDKGFLVMNGDSLDMKSFKDTTHKVSLNKGGEFVIDGNSYKGFAKISRLDSGTFTLDEIVAKPAGAGNKFTPNRLDINEGTTVRSLKSTKGYPEWQITSKQEGLAVFLDKTKATKLVYPAVSVTKGWILANKLARADLQSGPLIGEARAGTLYQRKPVDEIALKEFVSDSAFHKGNGYHLGVQSSTATSKGGVQGIDLNTLSERALSGMSYTEGKQMLRGDDVKEVQKMLRRLSITDGEDGTGSVIGVDGKFGPRTAQSIKNFQESIGAKQTGVLDAQTLQELYDANKEVYTRSIDGFEKGALSITHERYVSPGSVSEGFWPVPGQPMNRFGRGGYNTRSSFHGGVDLPADIGTPVKTAGDGIVTFAKWDPLSHGYSVEVYYQDLKYEDSDGNLKRGVTMRYSHLNGIPTVDPSTGEVLPSVDKNSYATNPENGKRLNTHLPKLAPGMTISEGQILAYSGKSGGSNPNKGTFPHLHFEVKTGVRNINPGTSIPNAIYDKSKGLTP